MINGLSLLLSATQKTTLDMTSAEREGGREGGRERESALLPFVVAKLSSYWETTFNFQ
jgi:hypothetical protein